MLFPAPFSAVATRLAPSPTGPIHLGNALSFLLCWLAARINGGKVILRIDDIDPQRSKPEFINLIKEDLAWLGLDWDAEIFQSKRFDLYETELRKLHNQGLIYPCFCTRKELRNLASAPHIGDEGAPYPGICASLSQAEQMRKIGSGRPYALRLACPQEDIIFEDLVQGKQIWNKNSYGGDFAIKRSDGVWAYQFASAIDDGDLNISFVLRGRDLLASTPRQIILSRLMGYPVPAYAHIGLILDHLGDRLAKRHSSLSIRSLRLGGARPQFITGFLAHAAGFNPDNMAISPYELAKKSALIFPDKDISLPEDINGRLIASGTMA